MKKYYEILGLPDQSDKALVKRAYRRLAMKYHPDKNDDKKANKKFILINEAYAKIMDESTHQHAWSTHHDKKTKAKEEELKKRMQWAKKYAQFKKDQEEHKKRTGLLMRAIDELDNNKARVKELTDKLDKVMAINKKMEKTQGYCLPLFV